MLWVKFKKRGYFEAIRYANVEKYQLSYSRIAPPLKTRVVNSEDLFSISSSLGKIQSSSAQ